MAPGGLSNIPLVDWLIDTNLVQRLSGKGCMHQIENHQWRVSECPKLQQGNSLGLIPGSPHNNKNTLHCGENLHGNKAKDSGLWFRFDSHVPNVGKVNLLIICKTMTNRL